MKKTERITFRLSTEEVRVVERKAKKANMHTSEYIRQAVLNKDIVIIEDLKEFMKNLVDMNRNLNQLTILSHQGKITSLNLENIKEELAQINKSLYIILKKRRG